ncbi:putative membrane protein [Streptomonospora nanhaiensis]|uniref:Putative membrane protein n=1 Tax=Streptomonospora nanhaiensis TaxID=1323731 RepID=A0A853BU46_9ACTN|nr:putative membrane protein [Streptomonospora nanhaiensis]
MRRPPALPPPARKAVLTVHVLASVGWAGLHAAVLTLVAAGLAAGEPERTGMLYGAAATLVQLLVLPVSLVALASGLALALGTPWGLFRHWWVAAKLGLTALLVAGSNLSLGPGVVELAEAAEGGAVLPPTLEGARMVTALSVALTVLAATTLLSTVKPFGRVRRAGRGRPDRSAPAAAPTAREHLGAAR